MNTHRLNAIGAGIALLGASALADPLAGDNGKDKVPDVVPLKVQPFPLEAVRLLDGPFKHAM